MARTTNPTTPPKKPPVQKHPSDLGQTAFGAAPTTAEQKAAAAAWIEKRVADGTFGPIDGWDPDDTFNGYMDVLGLNKRPMASTKTTQINDRRIANLT